MQILHVRRVHVQSQWIQHVNTFSPYSEFRVIVQCTHLSAIATRFSLYLNVINQFKALAKQSLIEGRLIGSYNNTLLFRIVNPEKSKMLIEQRCFLSVV